MAKLTAGIRAAGLGIISAMNRRPLAWLLAFPLVTAGSLTAHALAYQLVEPSPYARLDLLDRTGHGYLAAAPFVLGVCLAFVVAGLAAHAIAAVRRRPLEPPAAWPLALLPLLGFAFQEHLERLVATGDLPLGAAAEPSFLVGLALQLPFALAGLLAARLLGRAAEALGRALAGPPSSAPRLRPGAVARAVDAVLPPLAALAVPGSERGPPARR